MSKQQSSKAAAASTSNVLHVVPPLALVEPAANSINVVRGKRPSKYDALGPSDRRRFRKLARRAGMSVDEWMLATGNDNASRGRDGRGGDADVLLARLLGHTRSLDAVNVNGDVAWTSIAGAIRAAVASVSAMATAIGLSVERSAS